MGERNLRLDGYVRVSQVRGREGDTFISPSVQRERIEAWCTALGHELLVVHEELDESGKAGHQRPKLAAMLDRVDRKDTDGVIVWRAHRFGRSFTDSVVQLAKVREAGGVLVSVADGMDTSTSSGRMALNILLSIAEHHLDGIREGWHEAKARAVMRGVHPSATAPFGYVRGQDGRLEPDPQKAPLVRELFEQAARGDGYAMLGRWLVSTGARTQRGGSNWPMRAIKDVLRNEVYLGVAFARSRVDDALTVRNPNAHPPLVDPATWERAQRRGVKVPARGDDPHPLTVLMRCGGCRYSMRPARRQLTDGTVRMDFSCKSAHSSAEPCRSPARITDDGELLAYVENALLDAVPAIAASARTSSPRLGDLETQAHTARRAFEEWRDDARVQQQLGMDAYLKGLEARQAMMRDTAANLAREQAASSVMRLPAELADLRLRWPELPNDDRRELLHAAIAAVFVKPNSRGLEIRNRVRVVFRGEPVQTPVRGGRAWKPLPFDFDSDRPDLGVELREDGLPHVE